MRSRRVGTVAGVVTAVVLAACGPESAEPRDWMLGVFSTAHPSLRGGEDGVEFGPDRVLQFHIHEDLTMEAYSSRRSDWVQEGTWAPRNADELEFEQWPTDSFVEQVVVTRSGRCGPHRVLTVDRDGYEADYEWYPGAVCIEFSDPPGDGCHGFCRNWWYVWCDEPPEPCEEN